MIPVFICLLLMGCPSTPGGGEGPSEPDGGPSSASGEPRRRRPEKVDNEERLRRVEAVRRAVEELSSRRVKTDEFLLNLIVEEGAYKVAFVKHSRGKLRREISVRMKRENFEILSVEGLSDDMPNEADGGP